MCASSQSSSPPPPRNACQRAAAEPRNRLERVDDNHLHTFARSDHLPAVLGDRDAGVQEGGVVRGGPAEDDLVHDDRIGLLLMTAAETRGSSTGAVSRPGW